MIHFSARRFALRLLRARALHGRLACQAGRLRRTARLASEALRNHGSAPWHFGSRWTRWGRPKRAACYGMGDEPISVLLPPTLTLVCYGSWHSGILRGHPTSGFWCLGVRIRRWRRPTRTQAACTFRALLACSIPDPPPAAHTPLRSSGCWVRMLYIFTPYSRRDNINHLGQFVCILEWPTCDVYILVNL